jgi:hypothetical protein
MASSRRVEIDPTANLTLANGLMTSWDGLPARRLSFVRCRVLLPPKNGGLEAHLACDPNRQIAAIDKIGNLDTILSSQVACPETAPLDER